MKITTLALLSSLIAATHVVASEPALFTDFDLFNADDVINAKALIAAEVDAKSKPLPLSRSFLGRRLAANATKNDDGEAGTRCNADTEGGCLDELSCMAGYCLPSGESCYASAISDFNENFDSQEWIAGIFQQANFSQGELMDVAIGSGGYKGFQNSVLFQSLVHAAESSTPDQAIDLQSAIDLCDVNKARDAAANAADDRATENAPTSSGTIVYTGIHVELSGALDLAMSFFRIIGDVPEPRSWIRGSFGVEAGVGAEVSFLVGIAYTGTPADIEGASIIIDIDAGAIANVGTAIVINLNGLFSQEFTFGIGAGFGLGFGYGIANPRNPFVPTPSPTVAPPVVRRWTEGNVAESCDDLCGRVGRPCNADQQTAVNSAAKMNFVAGSVSRTCGTTTACSGVGNSYCPAITGSSECEFASNLAQSGCGISGGGQARICCCANEGELCNTS